MSARKALQQLSPIEVVISELARQKIKKVTSIVKEQEQILKALGLKRCLKSFSNLLIYKDYFSS